MDDETGKNLEETEENLGEDEKTPEKAEKDSEETEKTPEVAETTPEETETIPEETEKGLDLKKPLERMTVTELRELAKDIPGITGVHGMKKGDLISAIKAAKGIKDDVAKKSDSIKELKKQIQILKSRRETALQEKDKKLATIYRRQIARLKRKTRKAA